MTSTIPESTKKTPKARSPKGGKKRSSKKTVKRNGAVSKAWTIFDKHPKAERKDAVAAAVGAGVNPNTAKTQYQRWLHRKDKK